MCVCLKGDISVCSNDMSFPCQCVGVIILTELRCIQPDNIA